MNMTNRTTNNRKWSRGIVCFLVVILSIFISCETGYASDVSQTDRKAIKVGYNPIEGYFMQSEDGVKSGYGYDILQKMLIYENWTYEYVGYDEQYSQNEMLSLLESGKLDMLSFVLKTDENMKKFNYSDLPIGNLASVIVVKSGNNNFSVNNYENWEGAKVGFLTGNENSEGFDRYARDNSFSCQKVQFDNSESLERAIQQNEIDIAVTNNFEELSGVWTLDQFDETPFYIVVNKNNMELLAEVNKALSKMQSEDPEYMNKLYQKYYTLDDAGSAIAYTMEESMFLEETTQNQKIFKAVINPNRKPLSYYENGEIKGLLKDICQTIFERSGLNVEFIVTETRDEYMAEIEDADIICDFTGDYGKAEDKGFILTEVYYNSTTSMLRRKDYDGKGNRCALVGSSISGWLRENMDVEFISYDSVEECTQAVIDGEADFVYSYTRCVQEWVYSDITNALVVVPDNHQNTDFSIAVKNSENVNLSSILLKSIDTITTEDISSISDAYTYYQKGTPSLLSMIYAQPVFFVIMILLVVVLIFGSVLFIIIIRQRKNDQIKNIQLSEALDNAEEAEKERTDFFSRVSHDMRTPMNGILGLAELSINEKNITILQENMGKIQESGKYLLGLINDTLNYQKIDAGHMKLQKEVISTQRLLESGVEMIKQEAKNKGVTFRVNNKNTDFSGYILADAMYMKKMLVNLLSNAVKFTPSGGMVELGFETLGRDENIVHERITVTDTGIGMSQEFLTNGIFKPFSQEHNDITPLHEGTGLGLSISKQLAELMGGRVQVESEQGKGTKFIIDIDLETVDPGEVGKTEEAGEMEKGAVMEKINGRCILLVEDHPLNAQIATKLLQKAGCTITWAKDGQEAVELFVDSDIHRYDVVLMDIRMPVMNGLEAAKEIRAMEREDAKSIPIIALTANAYEEDVKNCLDAGMNAHIAKPIDPLKMYAAIAEVLEESDQQR